MGVLEQWLDDVFLSRVTSPITHKREAFSGPLRYRIGKNPQCILRPAFPIKALRRPGLATRRTTL
jgi:hypothetical protein